MERQEYTFSPDTRLLTTAEFRKVMEQPVKIYLPGFILFARKLNHAAPRLGITVSKRVSKRAVDRNKIKRLIRESFRLNQYKLPDADLVVIVRPDIMKYKSKQVFIQLENAWERLAERCAK